MRNDAFALGGCRGSNSSVLSKGGLMWSYKWPIQLRMLYQVEESGCKVFEGTLPVVTSRNHSKLKSPQ
jgi:hypothetical protein